MKKDFKNWNRLKQHIDGEGANCFYHEREIWWCSLGANVGFEEDGKGPRFERPILVIHAFNRHLCWAVPLSTSNKKNPFYIPVGSIGGTAAFAIVSQVRPLDTKRFINRIGYVDHNIFEKTKQAIKDVL